MQREEFIAKLKALCKEADVQLWASAPWGKGSAWTEWSFYCNTGTAWEVQINDELQKELKGEEP